MIELCQRITPIINCKISDFFKSRVKTDVKYNEKRLII